MEELTFAAPCLFGLEKMLGEEIDALGCKRTETLDGRVLFRAPLTELPRILLSLRFAERVLIVLGDFRADTFDALFEGTKALPWEEFIGETDRFPVKGHSVKSKLFSVPDCQKIVKKAVVDRLASKYGVSCFEETDILCQIEFFLLRDRAFLMLDATGVPLHKRGYRPESVTAPLRETLAAALASLARPREDVLFWDPMCGSGTIAIEAAMMMTHRAPGLGRSFAAEDLPLLSLKVWEEARERAESEIVTTSFECYASDIDPECVRIAGESARRAGVSAQVKVFQKDALTVAKDGRRGTIVCNPPYGERLMTPAAVEDLYRKMGTHFKELDPWQIYILTSHDGFERLYGRRADKVRKLYNGMIPCYFYQYFKRNDR